MSITFNLFRLRLREMTVRFVFVLLLPGAAFRAGAASLPETLEAWLDADAQLHDSADHPRRAAWVGEARRAHAVAPAGGGEVDGIVTVSLRYVQARFVAEWAVAPAMRTAWREQVLQARAEIDAILGDAEEDGMRDLFPPVNLAAAYWPVVTGGARRELALEVIDEWVLQPELPVEVRTAADARRLARGFERYGRRDAAVVVLELALDRTSDAGDRAALQTDWHALTGGAQGRVLPPPTPFPGNPPPVPYWAFRPWVWEDNGNTAESTLSLVDEYLARGIPVGAVIIDSPWSTAYNDFNWDRARYPDPQGLVDALHARDVKVVMWLTGTVNETSKDTPLQADPAGDEVVAKGYAIDDGRVFDWWKGRGRLIDFSNPEAVSWWAGRFDQVAALGIDGWKVDMSDDYTDEYVDTFLGRLPRAIWRQYYYAALHDVSRQRNPDSIVVARPFSHQGGFAAPVSKCTIGWSGDFPGTWDGMRKQLRDLYVSARAGYGTAYYEVGGYQRIPPDKEQLIRHAQLGAFLPVMSNGGANGGLTAHLPWWHDEETVTLYRRFAQWHAALAPYFFGLAREAHVTGTPIMRAVDPERWQHQLGQDIFVAPVFEADTHREVELPGEGRWRDWWSGALLKSGPWAVPLARYAVAVREGAVIPLDLREGLADWEIPPGQLEFALWVVPGEARETVVWLPTGDGLEACRVQVGVSEHGRRITVRGGPCPALSLVLATRKKPVTVGGVRAWRYDAAGGGRLIAELGEGDATIELRYE